MHRVVGAVLAAAALALVGNTASTAAQGWPGYWPPGAQGWYGLAPYGWSAAPFGGRYQVVAPAAAWGYPAGAYAFNATSCPLGTIPVAGTPWQSICVESASVAGSASGGVSEPPVAAVAGDPAVSVPVDYPPGARLCYAFPPRPC